MPNTATTVYLGLGSNLGDRAGNIAQALEMLSEKVIVQRLSSLYETAPVGYKEQPSFLNVVCQGQTELGPEELLHLVKDIERQLGRRPSFPNAPRPIDIDILLYDDSVLDSPELTLPHPRMMERAFVLVPLAEIAPDLALPGKETTVSQRLAQLSKERVRLWSATPIS